MTDGPTTPPPSGLPGRQKSLVERAKDIILQPKSEWAVVDAEPSTIGGIFTSYVMILAAIGPIAMIIGYQLIGVGYGFKPPLGFTIATAAVTYILSLVGVYVLSLIIDALAPNFGGTKNSLNAFKVAAYSWTPAWLAGIFNIIPPLAILGLVGLYSLYLLYLGLPRLMRVSEDKAAGYAVVVIVVQIVLYFVLIMLAGLLVASFMGPMIAAPVMRY
jgi:hypothetical protein